MPSNGAGVYSRASRTCSAWNHLAQINLQTSNPFRKNFVHMPDIYTFHVNHPMQPLCVLQPLKCVSHENRPARHAIKWSRRLFSCLAHMQCMEPSCTNKITDLKPFQKKLCKNSLTLQLSCKPSHTATLCF